MKAIVDLTIKQLQQLSGKKFQEEGSLGKTFSFQFKESREEEKDSLFEKEQSRAGFSIERGAIALIKIHFLFQIKTIQRFLRSPENCRNDFPRWCNNFES